MRAWFLATRDAARAIAAAQRFALEESAMRSCTILMLGLAILLTRPLVSSADGAQASKPARKTVTGKVTDALGRPLAGAALELQDSSGKIVAKAKSDAEGRFSFASVAPA